MAPSEGVGEAASIPLPEHMQHTGLVEMGQVDHVFHLVHRDRVSLQRGVVSMSNGCGYLHI